MTKKGKSLSDKCSFIYLAIPRYTQNERKKIKLVHIFVVVMIPIYMYIPTLYIYILYTLSIYTIVWCKHIHKGKQNLRYYVCCHFDMKKYVQKPESHTFSFHIFWYWSVLMAIAIPLVRKDCMLYVIQCTLCNKKNKLFGFRTYFFKLKIELRCITCIIFRNKIHRKKEWNT